MLFKRKVTTVEAEQFLPKDGDTTFTLFGQECKVHGNTNLPFDVYCFFYNENGDEHICIYGGHYLVKDNGGFYTVHENYISHNFEPVKE